MTTIALGGLARAKATNALQRDTARASADRSKSAAKALIDCAAPQVVVTWPTPPPGRSAPTSKVAGGYAYKNSNYGVSRACPGGVGDVVTIKAHPKVVNADSGSGRVVVGLSSDAAGATPTACNVRWIGLEANTRRPVSGAGSPGRTRSTSTRERCRLATTSRPSQSTRAPSGSPWSALTGRSSTASASTGGEGDRLQQRRGVGHGLVAHQRLGGWPADGPPRRRDHEASKRR